jgi:CDGSH-type Zn-finger protein
MARLVRITHDGPYRIDPADFPKDGKPIWICMCGITSKPPYCDGTHKACRGEQPGLVYTYDPQTRRVTGARPDDPAPEQGGR